MIMDAVHYRLKMDSSNSWILVMNKLLVLTGDACKYMFTTTCILFALQSEAQEVKIVKKTRIYKEQAQNDSNHCLTEIKSLIPEILYDLKYARKDNFTGRQLYPSGERTYLRLPAAKALAAACGELKTKGYGIKIFDAYRPYSVTRKMWDLIGDERYVANPAKGSGHNRGLAIDLTLVDLSTGSEVEMGTPFDNFTDTAHHDFNMLPEQVRRNRFLLRNTLEKLGFSALPTEWWHYAWPNNGAYDLLDLSFQKLKLITAVATHKF